MGVWPVWPWAWCAQLCMTAVCALLCVHEVAAVQRCLLVEAVLSTTEYPAPYPEPLNLSATDGHAVHP